MLAAGIEAEPNPAELVERHDSDTTRHPPCSRLPPANGGNSPKITFAGIIHLSVPPGGDTGDVGDAAVRPASGGLLRDLGAVDT